MLKSIAHLWTDLFGGCFSACVFRNRSLFSRILLGMLTKHLKRTSSLIHFEQIYIGVFLARNAVSSMDLKSIKERNHALKKKSNEIQIIFEAVKSVKLK